MQSNNDIYEHYKKNPDKENVFVILSNINKKGGHVRFTIIPIEPF